MKKIFACLLITLSGTFAFANTNDYFINETEVEALFNQSEDITLSSVNELTSFSNVNSGSVLAEGQSVGGYLLRAFFCGSFALHRSYMGTGGETMWWKYLCIPVVGGVTGCIDFWWVVFKGTEAMNKYKDNPKFMVWAK